MHLFKCANRFDLVVNTYITQPYRIVFSRECTANNAFPTDLVVGPSRDGFATDSFEMSDRRDIVKNFETCGLQQIKPPTAKVRVSYYCWIG